VSVPDGPESLVIDAARGRAYSHTWANETLAIDLKTRKVVSTWRNGCRGSRGIALDQKRGLLFAGCAEGKATVVDLATGELVSSAPAGPEVDSIGYSASLGHLYVPAGGSGELWIYGVPSDGKLALLGKVSTASDAHTVAFDPGSNAIFVGTPDHGAVLVIRDAFPPSSN
jgi:DNA-binding beta-propeller fold protein YncE